MNRIKYIIIVVAFFNNSPLNAQLFFKNSQVITSWKVGNIKSKTAQLNDGSTISLDFDGFTLNAAIIKKDQTITLHKFNDGGPWNKIDITAYDFDKDGKNEIAIVYGDTKSLLFGLLVYKIKNNTAIEIGDLQGQVSCSFYKNRITITQDTKGKPATYLLKTGKFVKKV